MDPTTKYTGYKRRGSDRKQLESWKAIANYLHRSVRTVRRWEVDEGLPVHRHLHSSGSSIYAYCAELDAWRDNHEVSLQHLPAREAAKPLLFPSLATYAVIALAALITGVLVGKFVLESGPGQGGAKSTHDTWVLITTPIVADRHEDIGKNLKSTLRREISSGYHVLPEERVQAALRLMRQDPQIVLSPSIAKEIAIRDGRVSVLLIPRLEQLGDTYSLSVEIVDPNNDQLISYAGEKINNLRSIMGAVERLARGINADLLQLPENLGAARLPQVTTDSMLALRLYSRAADFLIDNRPMVAQELLEVAIREDPKFASALALRAWAMMRAGAIQATYLPVSKEAMELSKQLMPAERYFIEGSYRHFSGALDRADASYYALLDIEPNHLFGAQAKLDLCLGLKPSAGCIEERMHLANLRPDHFEFNLQAAWALAAEAGNTKLASDYAERTLEIWRSTDDYYAPRSVARALILKVFNVWSEGDLQGALRTSQQLRENLPSLQIETQNLLIEHLAEFSIVLGRVNDAEDLLERLSDSETRNELRARLLFASGNRDKLRNHLASGNNFKDEVTALLMAISGLPEQALALQNDLQSRGMSDARGAIVRAKVAFDSGDLIAAKSELQRAVAELTVEDHAFFFVGYDLLAAILQAEGQLTDAVRMLERMEPIRIEAAVNNAGLYWLMCQQHLARLYREIDQHSDATLVENELRELLLLADNNFPLRASLQ